MESNHLCEFFNHCTVIAKIVYPSCYLGLVSQLCNIKNIWNMYIIFLECMSKVLYVF